MALGQGMYIVGGSFLSYDTLDDFQVSLNKEGGLQVWMNKRLLFWLFLRTSDCQNMGDAHIVTRWIFLEMRVAEDVH